MIKTIDAETIHRRIEPMLANGVPIHDALLHLAETDKIEFETIAAIVNGSPILRAKVREAAEKLHLVKKSDQSTLYD